MYRLWILVVLLIVGCGRPVERAYFTLRYPAPEKRFKEPHPITVRVKELDIRESYKRSELVFRPDQHEIHYHRGRRWSERPQKQITALVTDHVRRSGLVAQVSDSIGQTPPDYTLDGEIIAIEQTNAGPAAEARLAMRLRLVRFADDHVVWTYDFDTRRPVGDAPTRAMVRTLSEILALEMDNALNALARHLSGEEPEAPMVAEEAVQETPDDDEVIKPSATSALNDLPQVMTDPTPVPVGKGAIFLPTMSGEGEREPLVAVSKDGNVVADGNMGKRIVLDPGDYQVKLGSGTIEQQLTYTVRVAEGRTTILEPAWASLGIDVVDEQFVPFRGNYELIRMDNREDFGVGFGADELQGEQVRIWVLEPGLYKIIRAGGTYRDRSDFATVRLEEGRFTRFTLVVDPEEGTFKGAGEVDPSETEAAIKDNWTFRGVIGGTVSFDRSDLAGEQEGWELELGVFLDGSASYREAPHQWVTRLDIEEEQSRPSDGDFTNEEDRLFLHSIYIYDLVPWFGPYIRGRVETSLFPRYQRFESETTLTIFDDDGNSRQETGDEFRIADSFSPMDLIESAGGNFRVFRTRAVELDLRLGFGVRHLISNGLRVYDDGDKSLRPVDTTHSYGPEGTIFGIARITRWVSLTTELDTLLPVNDSDDILVVWRNFVSIRLASFASLTYRFNAERDPAQSQDEKLRTQHDVQLRFSYTLF